MLINNKKYLKISFSILISFFAFIFFPKGNYAFGAYGCASQSTVALCPGFSQKVKKYVSDAGFGQQNDIQFSDTAKSSNTTEQFFNNEKPGRSTVVYRRILAVDGVIVYEWWVKTGSTPLAVDFKVVNTNGFDVAVSWLGPDWFLDGQEIEDVKPGYKLNPNYGLKVTGYADIFGPNEQKDARTHGKSSQRRLPLAQDGIWSTNWLSFSAPLGDFVKQKLSYKISDFKVLVKQHGHYIDVKKANQFLNNENDDFNKNSQGVVLASSKKVEENAAVQQKRNQQLNLLSEQAQKQTKAWQNIINRVLLLRDPIITNLSQQNFLHNEVERNQKFTELETLINTKNGSLVTCSHCTGIGFKSCDHCNAAGYIKCTSCERSGKVKCSLCGGTKLFRTKTCTQCQGAGYQECVTCSGKGETMCIYCGGLGNIQCSQCIGVGKEFKQDALVENGG